MRKDGFQHKKRVATFAATRLILPRHWPTLPTSCPVSTIGAGGLNFRIRNGNGCGPSANSTGINIDNNP